MLVCWDWLTEYVDIDVQPDDMALRFAMSGLNHESTESVGSDTVIDLEVTSNRGDCLGHLGVAREAAVLLEKPLKVPEPLPAAGGTEAAEALQVENRFVEGCPEYTARIIRGVKVGPSPSWLVRRLAAIGINSVNNIVDITNYVMMECGQPLHAFDLKHIRGGKIVVRPAQDKEKFLAIDHKTYELDPQMVVIADAERAVALGGVMGGADSEVSDDTVDLLIEAARFTPLAIRRTARKLKLHSPSSYRFERTPDQAGLDWASRRCCALILELAGGELAEGMVRGGEPVAKRSTIAFRLGQIPRILGVDVPQAQVVQILTRLGCSVQDGGAEWTVTPPTWRADLTREVDLVEEVARIYGYEKIPENMAVPIGVAAPRPRDVAIQRMRHALSAYGVDEAMTPSVVGEALEHVGSLWSTREPLATDTPLLVGSKMLRRALLPSLLAARYTNQAQAGRRAQLYEIATIYLPGQQPVDLPAEQSTLGIVTDGDLQLAKGVVEEIIGQVAKAGVQMAWNAHQHPLLEDGSGLRISCGQRLIGFVGLVSRQVQEKMSLAAPVAAAELNVEALTELLQAVRTAAPVSAFPATSRDLNFIVEERLSWAELSSVCQQHGGPELRQVEFQEIYRDAKKDGAGKKRMLLTLHFQSLSRTLTGEEVDAAVEQVIQTCSSQFHAKLLG